MSNVKQVIVMRSDLGMRKGKMIAQGAHAAMMFLIKNLTSSLKSVDGLELYHIDLSEVQVAWIENLSKPNIKKITVRVESEKQLLEIHEAAKNAGLVSHLVTDNGLTEFKGVPTNTCIAIGPDISEKIDPITGNLPLF